MCLTTGALSSISLDGSSEFQREYAQSWRDGTTSMWLVTYLLSILGFLLALVLVGHVLDQHRSPSSTLAWLIVIILLPYVGVPLYLLIGGRKVRQLAATKRQLYPTHSLEHADPTATLVERLLVGTGAPGARTGNRVELLGTGEYAYTALRRMILDAEETVYVTSFILGRDEVGQEVVSWLTKRAKDGLDVRVVLDALGSFWSLRKSVRPLIDAGGRVTRFMPMLSWPGKGSFNLRNHRKLVVVDGRKAMIGGMNLAREYMGPIPSISRWRDLALIIEGPGVKDIESIFFQDWNFAAPRHRLDTVNRPFVPPLPNAGGLVQVLGSGPDVPDDPLYDAFLSLVFAAKQRVWIATPYFVPDMALTRALMLAARRGVDVRILIPAHSNHAMADLARGSYLREINRAGAQIYRFTQSMMHAKVAIFDHSCAIVGSANLDMRSLFINYELSVFLYSRPEVDELAAWIGNQKIHSLSGLPRRSWAGQLGENMARLLAPLV